MAAPVILGCAGPRLGDEERRFFADADPWGFILFSRNVSDPDGVARLVEDLRGCVGRRAPVLVDQEGGAVARLKPPHWRAWPAVGPFLEGAVAGGPKDGAEEIRLARLAERFEAVARELHGVGIDVNCMPVLDVPCGRAHPAIADRVLGADPETVARRGRRICEAMMGEGVLPVVKHIPGHGRARADSHEELPVVDAPLAELESRDFAPFRELADMPMAMTAHIAYSAIDPDRPATLSSRVVERFIRRGIGFRGLLIGDDIGMGALRGPLRERASETLAAGCDIVLHCDGERKAMEGVMEGVGAASPETRRRMARVEALRGGSAPRARFADHGVFAGEARV